MFYNWFYSVNEYFFKVKLNLVVLIEICVVKVNLKKSGKFQWVIGVIFIDGIVIIVCKEVILFVGFIQLLNFFELLGIGGSDIFKVVKIKQFIDFFGVGENY